MKIETEIVAAVLVPGFTVVGTETSEFVLLNAKVEAINDVW